MGRERERERVLVGSELCTNHEAKREGAYDGEGNGDGRELEVADVADEYGGDEVEAEDAECVQSDGHSNLPHSHTFNPYYLL